MSDFKFDPAEVTAQTPVEVDVESQSIPVAPRVVKEAPGPKEPANEYEVEAQAMMNNIADVVTEGRNLRAEAEGLITWRRVMGEGSAKTSLGQAQREYAIAYLLKLRARAVELKTEIAARCKNPAHVLDHIFGPPYRFQCPEEITNQARQELGLTDTAPTFPDIVARMK